jgi:endoglucanase
VSPLRASGVGQADGFALNVGNFYGTDTTIRYGTSLSRQLGGAHFVIDTGRNGNGPAPVPTDGAPKWCNPPGRALGQRPTGVTRQPRVDAYLWVKPPGDSDGPCRRGAPVAGQWWTAYALGLVKRSSNLGGGG